MRRFLGGAKDYLRLACFGSLAHEKAGNILLLYMITILFGSAWVAVQVLTRYQEILGWTTVILLVASGGFLIWGYRRARPPHDNFVVPWHLRVYRKNWRERFLKSKWW